MIYDIYTYIIMTKIKGILSNIGLCIPIDQLHSTLGYPILQKLKNRYTIRVKIEITNTVKTIHLYQIIRDRNYICFPKFSTYYLFKKGIIHNIENRLTNGESVRLTYTGKSNPNQLLIIDHLFKNHFNTNTFGLYGATLKVKAGLGKTYIAMDIISRINRKTLIIVPNTYLLNQWVELLTNYFPENTIGTMYGKKHKDGDIIVSIINSASQLDEFKIEDELSDSIPINDLYKSIGLVILDESHMYISTVFRKVFYRIHSKYIIGLTATPNERKDRQDFIHTCNVGPVLDAEMIPQYQKADDRFISDVHIVKYNAPEQYTTIRVNNGILDYNFILNNLIEDPYRNQLIIDSIHRLMEKELNIYVFSDRRQHLEKLFHCFQTQQKKKNITYTISVPELDLSSTILYGGSKENEIEMAKKRSNVIFTTYQYSGTGVSIIKMNGLILATPRKSNMTQIINRIFRLGSDQSQRRIIIDIVDNRTKIKNQYYKRKEAYIERECDIITSVIHYKDIQL